VSIVCIDHGLGHAEIDATAESVTRQIDQDCELLVALPSEIRDTLGRARGRWLMLVDAGDRIRPHAIAQLAAATDADAAVDCVYSDESGPDASGAEQPFYKPDWSPDRLRCQPYLGRAVLVRRDLIDEAGGWRPELGRVAEFDLMLRVGELSRRVAHVAHPLCRRRGPQPEFLSFAPEDVDAGCRVVDEHLARTGIAARARPHASASGLLRLEPVLVRRPLVSVIVPTAGTRRVVRGSEISLVDCCVQSVLTRSTYAEIEVICVVDASVDDDTRARLVGLDPARVRLVDFSEPFNFARKINRGVVASRGEVLVLLNDDTEVREPGWLEAMLVYALDPEVGAVGARLLFADDRIQHAGVAGVRGNPGHPYYGLPADTVGHGGNALVPSDVLAVTAACLMTSRACFESVGGLSGSFPVNYNDIDYCLKLRQNGLRIVVTPDAVLYHHESSSRSGEVAPDELALVRRRWGRWLRDDPFYGPNFPSGNADFVPAPAPSSP
jgi:GT2 family glycosyltransferase